MAKSYAVPGQTPRPALDAVLADLEEQADTGRCGVCGMVDLRNVKYGGRAWFNHDTGEMTPWMCPQCAAAYQKQQESADG